MNKQKPVLVVSGGSRGLGSCLVLEGLAAGYAVATCSRSITPFIEQLLANPSYADSFFWQAVNVTDDSSLKQFIHQVIAHFGEISALVNNAGMASSQLLSLAKTQDMRVLIELNLTSTLVLSQLCIKSMLRNRGGAIVSISSVNALRGHTGVACYSASKAGLDGLTRSLARELGASNIRVNSLAPGYFESDMVADLNTDKINTIIRRTPLKRLASTQDIANAVLFLLSAKASFITGQCIAIDGGITC